MLRGNIWRTEGNAPVEKQAQLCPHGVRPRFHDHKAAFGDGFQFVRRHEGPLHHLQALAGIILTPANRAGQYRAAAQRLGELLRRLAVGGEATEDGILAVIGQYLCPLSPIVFLQLRQRLDDRYHRQPTGAPCAEQRQDVKGGHGPQLIAEEHNTTRQPPAVFIRHGEQLPCQRLDHQACHEIFSLILLRQN